MLNILNKSFFNDIIFLFQIIFKYLNQKFSLNISVLINTVSVILFSISCATSDIQKCQRQDMVLMLWHRQPLKLSEIFAVISDYDRSTIFLNSFLDKCNTAYNMATDNQQVLLVMNIKNRHRGRASEIINSRNPTKWEDIKPLLDNQLIYVTSKDN